jgi:hypothetical protein
MITFSVYLPLMMEATGKMMLQGTLTSNTRHVVVDEKFPALYIEQKLMNKSETAVLLLKKQSLRQKRYITLLQKVRG